MNKQEYESLKSGDKLKIVSLDNTTVGDGVFEIGEVVEFVEHLTGSSSKNDILIKRYDGYSWFMSSKDLEVVKDTEHQVIEDLVNSPKHYATDPSGVECIQIKRNNPVKSDGGSSDYYKRKIPSKMLERWVCSGEIEAKDVMKLFLMNDFNMCNVFKAYCRVSDLRSGGGKIGASEEYDLKKASYFAEDSYVNYMDSLEG